MEIYNVKPSQLPSKPPKGTGTRRNTWKVRQKPFLTSLFYHFRTVINLQWSWTMHGNKVLNQGVQLTLILP